MSHDSEIIRGGEADACGAEVHAEGGVRGGCGVEGVVEIRFQEAVAASSGKAKAIKLPEWKLRARRFWVILSAIKILLFFLVLGAAAHAGISAKIVEAARKQIGLRIFR